MIYSSPLYILFLFITVVLFSALPSRGWRQALLIFASLLFYAHPGTLDLFILAVVVLVSWFLTFLALRFPQYKNTFLTLGILLMLLHLFVWKYASWVVTSLQSVAPTFLDGRLVLIQLPIGISFFTLQAIAYLVDFGRNEAKFMGLGRYTLFKSFFPQLIAGPIVRAHDLSPQLDTLHRPTYSQLSSGVLLFSLGLFKKVFISEHVSVFVDRCFESPAEYSRYALVWGLIGYSIQIWADFSGYTDMARGSARMLGLMLPENFRAPYFSKSPSEFWSRWHITLSEWIRDYIFNPLALRMGRTKAGLLSVLLISMFISGLWHGANATFVLWGIYHGCLLIGERLLKTSRINRMYKAHVPKSLQPFGLALTFFPMILMSWVFFRSSDLTTIYQYFNGLFFSPGHAVPLDLSRVWMGAIFCLAVHILTYQPLSLKSKSIHLWVEERLQAMVARLNVYQQTMLGMSYGLAVSIFVLVGIFMRPARALRNFIYFQF